jgi:hypothetical protein
MVTNHPKTWSHIVKKTWSDIVKHMVTHRRNKIHSQCFRFSKITRSICIYTPIYHLPIYCRPIPLCSILLLRTHHSCYYYRYYHTTITTTSTATTACTTSAAPLFAVTPSRRRGDLHPVFCLLWPCQQKLSLRSEISDCSLAEYDHAHVCCRC